MSSLAVPAVDTSAYPKVDQSPKTSRLVSLDVFRGMVVVLMSNVADDFGRMHWRLGHAPWNGFFFADWAFPSFLFIVGAAIAYSMSSRMARGAHCPELIRHAATRTVVIYVIGILLELVSTRHLNELRWVGPLQRIAVIYFIVTVLALTTKPRTWWIVTVGLLVGYWAMMRFIPVPGVGAGHFDPVNNLASYIDRRFLPGHLFGGTWDSEGLLSTLPAIASCLFGLLTAEWLRRPMPPRLKWNGMLWAGGIMMVAGLALNPVFPINKNLWTSTFVLLTTGISLILLASCFWITDIKGWKSQVTPLVAFGMNPLVVYVGARIIDHASHRIGWTVNGQWQSAKFWVFWHFFAPLSHNVHIAWFYWWSLHIVFFWILTAILYRRRIFIRI